MSANVSLYPRVAEWIYLGDTAVNMAQVTAIEFGDTYAIIRLSSYNAEDEHGERDKTWFKVRDAETVRVLRAYVRQTLAAEPEQDKAAPRR